MQAQVRQCSQISSYDFNPKKNISEEIMGFENRYEVFHFSESNVESLKSLAI